MRRLRALRIAVLLTVLAMVALWAAATHKRRDRRLAWKRTVHAAVILLEPKPQAKARAPFERGLEALQQWIATEGARRRTLPEPPVDFELFGPVAAAAPQFEPPDDGLWTRAKHAWSLSRALARLDAEAGLDASRFDLRLYVALEPASSGQLSVEGAGEVGGDVALVRARDDGQLDLTLPALAHELFHCFGATDKYDAAGHARVPDGLVEPARGFPQQFGEIMVGEVPTAPGSGRLPASLAELRVGDATAVELRWLAQTRFSSGR